MFAVIKFVMGMGGEFDSADCKPEVEVLNWSYAVDTVHACTVDGCPVHIVPAIDAPVRWTAGRVRVIITNMEESFS